MSASTHQVAGHRPATTTTTLTASPWVPDGLPLGPLANYTPQLHVDTTGTAHLNSRCPDRANINWTETLGVTISESDVSLCEECAVEPDDPACRHHAEVAWQVAEAPGKQQRQVTEFHRASEASKPLSNVGWTLTMLDSLATRLERGTSHVGVSSELAELAAVRAAELRQALISCRQQAAPHEHGVRWSLTAAVAHCSAHTEPVRNAMRTKYGFTDGQAREKIRRIGNFAGMYGPTKYRAVAERFFAGDDLVTEDVLDTFDTTVGAVATQPATTTVLVKRNQPHSMLLRTAQILLCPPNRRADDNWAVLPLPPAAASGAVAERDVDHAVVIARNVEATPENLQLVTSVLRDAGPLEDVAAVAHAAVVATC